MRACVLVAVGSLLVACGGASPAATSPAANSPGAVPATAALATASPGTATGAARTGAPRPAFLTIPLTDVRTGERFTLGGFEGKVVIGIAMAVW